MATLTLQQRLTQAEDALHRLQIGQSFVRVADGAGRMTEFTPASIDKLQAYVDDLTEQVSGTIGNPRGAIGFVF